MNELQLNRGEIFILLNQAVYGVLVKTSLTNIAQVRLGVETVFSMFRAGLRGSR
jgi:hypothetical protein